MSGSFPLFVHPEWRESFPWLFQGMTGRGFDLRLFGSLSRREALARWGQLRGDTGFRSVIHARQPHGGSVALHMAGGAEPAPGEGLILAEDCDGHVGDRAGALLTVGTADCVPVFMVADERRAVALLHAGWRGVVAGIMEEGVNALVRHLSVDPAKIHLHLGPAICGSCYEVGAEVHRALGLPEPEGAEPLDLREAISRRGEAAGLSPHRMTTSAFCTRCGDPPFYSHRGGDAGRQMGLLGIRSESGDVA